MKRIGKGIGVVLTVALFATLALGSGSESSSVEKVGEVGNSTIISETKESVENVIASVTSVEESIEPTIETEENSEQTKYAVGDVLKYNGLYITYVSSSDYKSDNSFIQPADGNKFIRLYFYVDNQSGSDKTVSVYDFNCFADGYECEKTYEDDDLSATLSNGRTGEGAVYFEVPKDATEIEVEYELDWLSEKKVIFTFEGDKDSGFVPEKNAVASESTYHVGDIIENGSIRITYLSSNEYTDYGYFGPEDGMKYIYIELEVENISDSDQSISYFSFECYADGSSCNGYYGMDDGLSASLSPGRKAKGSIAFEVPKDAGIIEIEYEDNFWTERKIIFSYE